MKTILTIIKGGQDKEKVAKALIQEHAVSAVLEMDYKELFNDVLHIKNTGDVEVAVVRNAVLIKKDEIVQFFAELGIYEVILIAEAFGPLTLEVGTVNTKNPFVQKFT